MAKLWRQTLSAWTKDGRTLDVQISAALITKSNDGISSNMVIFRDVTERKRTEMAHADRNNQPLALAMIDIDHFKKVNDTYGHATGDRILKALTHMLTRRFRQSDIIGRYGGEEFVAVLPDTDDQIAFQIANELCKAFFLVRHISDGKEFFVTFSCGVAAFPKYQTPASLSEFADRALYIAKRQGRNQVVLSE